MCTVVIGKDFFHTIQLTLYFTGWNKLYIYSLYVHGCKTIINLKETIYEYNSFNSNTQLYFAGWMYECLPMMLTLWSIVAIHGTPDFNTEKIYFGMKLV